MPLPQLRPAAGVLVGRCIQLSLEEVGEWPWASGLSENRLPRTRFRTRSLLPVGLHSRSSGAKGELGSNAGVRCKA